MDSKKWYLSKTVWAAFLVFIVSILNIAGLTDLELAMDAEWIGVAISVIFFVLRLVTKEPVK